MDKGDQRAFIREWVGFLLQAAKRVIIICPHCREHNGALSHIGVKITNKKQKETPQTRGINPRFLVCSKKIANIQWPPKSGVLSRSSQLLREKRTGCPVSRSKCHVKLANVFLGQRHQQTWLLISRHDVESASVAAPTTNGTSFVASEDTDSLVDLWSNRILFWGNCPLGEEKQKI